MRFENYCTSITVIPDGIITLKISKSDLKYLAQNVILSQLLQNVNGIKSYSDPIEIFIS